jgi:ribonuclease-3
MDGLSGHRFRNPDLLDLALSHRSWCAENDGAPSNERLEFLGDAVLGWIVADLLVRRYPSASEGQLTDLRKSLVSAEALAEMAREIGLGRWIRLGAGERDAGGHDKTSILADALEALIGALYLDAGVTRARRFVRLLVLPRARAVWRRLDRVDARSRLIRVCVREHGRPPVVQTVSSGRAHEPSFEATIVVEGETLGRGIGSSKKVAIQRASEEVLDVLVARGVDVAGA